MRQKKKKPTNKDLVYNIALNKSFINEVFQRLMLLEEVIYKYIEMKKETKKFNKYIQDEIENKAAEDAKNTKKEPKSSD